jgi:hypothetical protein
MCLTEIWRPCALHRCIFSVCRGCSTVGYFMSTLCGDIAGSPPKWCPSGYQSESQRINMLIREKAARHVRDCKKKRLRRSRLSHALREIAQQRIKMVLGVLEGHCWMASQQEIVLRQMSLEADSVRRDNHMQRGSSRPLTMKRNIHVLAVHRTFIERSRGMKAAVRV